MFTVHKALGPLLILLLTSLLNFLGSLCPFPASRVPRMNHSPCPQLSACIVPISQESCSQTLQCLTLKPFSFSALPNSFPWSQSSAGPWGRSLSPAQFPGYSCWEAIPTCPGSCGGAGWHLLALSAWHQVNAISSLRVQFSISASLTVSLRLFPK